MSNESLENIAIRIKWLRIENVEFQLRLQIRFILLFDRKDAITLVQSLAVLQGDANTSKEQLSMQAKVSHDNNEEKLALKVANPYS